MITKLSNLHISEYVLKRQAVCTECLMKLHTQQQLSMCSEHEWKFFSSSMVTKCNAEQFKVELTILLLDWHYVDQQLSTVFKKVC